MTLTSVRLATRPGAASARREAIMPPMEWPTTCARDQLKWSCGQEARELLDPGD